MAEERAVKAGPEPVSAPGTHEGTGSPGLAAGPVLAAQRAAGNAAVSRALSVQRQGLPVIGTALGGIIAMIRSGVTDRRGFLEAAYEARQRPIFRAEWDAWGHAVCGAGAARAGTEAEAWLLGTMREDFQDLFGQDSSAQDRHNQAVGRSLVSHDWVRSAGPEPDVGGILARCTEAYLQGRLRIGPDRATAYVSWLPSDSDFVIVRTHEGAMWCPRRGRFVADVGEWVEAVDPGPAGLANGSGRSPTTPMPAEEDPPTPDRPYEEPAAGRTGRILY